MKCHKYARCLSHGVEEVGWRKGRGWGGGGVGGRGGKGGEGEGNFLLSTLSGGGTGCHLLTRVIFCVSFLSFLSL